VKFLMLRLDLDRTLLTVSSKGMNSVVAFGKLLLQVHLCRQMVSWTVRSSPHPRALGRSTAAAHTEVPAAAPERTSEAPSDHILVCKPREINTKRACTSH
jgi:hypothetical protein